MTKLEFNLLEAIIDKNVNKENTNNFFNNVKGLLSWEEYLKTQNDLINSDLLILNDDDSFFITELGKNRFSQAKKSLLVKQKDERAKRIKLHNESIMSGWKRKTFWYIFFCGVFGGIYSGIDLFNKITSNKEVPKEQLTKQEMEVELTKLRTLILSQKNLDSLSRPSY